MARRVARNVHHEHAKKMTLGERLSDRLAETAGSWRFILGFLFGMVLWMGFNVFAPQAFDVYPFILLNLLLSTLAALQAPIIMMSQRRQEQRDRLRSEADYDVNLKAEQEIEALHVKLDSLHEKYEQLLQGLIGQST